MATWMKVDALLRSTADSDKREMLGLDNLEVETIIKPIVIDVAKIESFAQTIDDEGNGIEDETDVIMDSGLSMTVKVSFNDFFVQLTKKPK